jgi:hypothetical protein
VSANVLDASMCGRRRLGGLAAYLLRRVFRHAESGWSAYNPERDGIKGLACGETAKLRTTAPCALYRLRQGPAREVRSERERIGQHQRFCLTD